MNEGKNSLIKKLGIISLALVLMLSIVSALTVDGKTSYTTCQCDATKEFYRICADVDGSYSISIEGTAASWFSMAPTTVYLNAGECKDIVSFLTPSCYASSGIYSMNLKVTGPQELNKPIGVTVTQCHTFDYTITPLRNSSLPCEENIYNLYIKNTGRFDDEFVLLQKGLADSWVNYPKDKIVLKSGEEFSSQIKVKSTCSTTPSDYPFNVTLSNTQTNATKTIDLVQTINAINAVESTFSKTPITVETCSIAETEYDFYIKNISSVADEYTLDISDKNILSLSKTKINLSAGETAQISLKVSKANVQKLNSILSITSKEYNSTYKHSFVVDIKNCYDLSLERLSKSTESCFNSTDHLFKLNNGGTKELRAKITITGVEAETSEVVVAAKSSRDFYIKIDPKSIGEKKIIVTAESTGLSKTSIEYDFNVKNCYDIEVKVPTVKVCPETESRNKVIFTNKGTEDQTVNINLKDAPWVKFESNKVLLPAGQSVEVYFDMQVPTQINSKYVLGLISYSPGLDGDIVKAVLRESDITTEIFFEMNTLEECYSFKADYVQEYLDINCCQGKIVDLNITNTGYFTSRYDLKKIAPEWVDFSDTNLVIESGETKTVYVYFHPPAGTSGQIKSKILITPQKGNASEIEFDLNVYGGYCGLSYSVDLNVDNSVSTTKEFTRKEITVDFVVKNDSNFGFAVSNISVKDFNSTADFNKGIFLQPGESTTTKITIMTSENEELKDQEVVVLVDTSVGQFEKKQFVKFSEAKTVDTSISGFFGQYVAPVAGLVLLLVLLVIILVISGSAKGKKK
ncbi:MAG TPA: hypothetical protein PKK60_01555 [archaeon]|nr:hypothetical protein [archaeon]